MHGIMNKKGKKSLTTTIIIVYEIINDVLEKLNDGDPNSLTK